MSSNDDQVDLIRPNFWQHYKLDELNTAEWEALCDGCGGCCLEKFLDDPDKPYTVEYTDVACKLLECSTGHCANYEYRHQYVPECVSLTYDKLEHMMWLPENCAYKRLYLGLDLPKWHLLITGDSEKTKQEMRDAGVGVAGRCVSEKWVKEEELEARIVHWVHA